MSDAALALDCLRTYPLIDESISFIAFYLRGKTPLRNAVQDHSRAIVTLIRTLRICVIQGIATTRCLTSSQNVYDDSVVSIGMRMFT